MGLKIAIKKYINENDELDEQIKDSNAFDINLKYERGGNNETKYSISFVDDELSRYFESICKSGCHIVINDFTNLVKSIFLSKEVVSKRYGLGIKIIDNLLESYGCISFNTYELSPYSRKLIRNHIKSGGCNYIEFTHKIMLLNNRYDDIDDSLIYEKVTNLVNDLYYITISSKLKSNLTRSANKKILDIFKSKGLKFGMSKKDKFTKILSILSKEPDKIDKYKDFLLENYNYSTTIFDYSLSELFEYHPELILPLKNIAVYVLQDENAINDIINKSDGKTQDFLFSLLTHLDETDY